MIKMVFCARRREDIAPDEFYAYWLKEHGPLVKSFTDALNIRRYVQSHTQRPEFGAQVSADRGMKQAGFDSETYSLSFVEESNSVLVSGSVAYISNIELLVEAYKKDKSESKVNVKVIRYGNVGN